MHRWLPTLMVLYACGSEGSVQQGNELSDISDEQTADDISRDDLSEVFIDKPVEVTENFRIVYGYQNRFDPTKHELFLADPSDSDPNNDMSFTKSGLEKAGLNCNLGCFVDKKLKWIAVVTEQSQMDGTYTLKLGKFGTNLTVNLLKFGDLKGVKHVEFAENIIFFSQIQPKCESVEGPPSTCFVIKSLDLDKPAEIKTHLTFPPPNALAHSMFTGWFTVGEDGKTLLFLNPTNVSQSVWIWREGKLQMIGEKICSAKDPAGNCIGSGSSSSFKDTDPINITPDGKVLVYALVADNAELRLYRHEIETGITKYSVLLGVPSNYFASACENIADWQYNVVRKPIRFTPDGKEVIFIGENTCKENKEKSWTNIVRVSLDRIGAGIKLTKDDLVLVTNNPKGKIAKNVMIFYYDLSPSGEYVGFLGTAMLQSDNISLIPDTSSAHLDDVEVWVTRLDGKSKPKQITNQLQWKATSVLAVPTPK